MGKRCYQGGIILFIGVVTGGGYGTTFDNILDLYLSVVVLIAEDTADSTPMTAFIKMMMRMLRTNDTAIRMWIK